MTAWGRDDHDAHRSRHGCTYPIHSPRRAHRRRRLRRPPRRTDRRGPRADAGGHRRQVARRPARPDRPGRDPLGDPSRPARGPVGTGRDRGPAPVRRPEPTADELDRYGLHEYPHAGRHPPQRARGPGLVHRLHPVPAGDQPGPAGGAAQLPDHGQRADRAADRQRLTARRGDRCSRGDDDGPAPRPVRFGPLRGPPRHPSPDRRRARHARRADRGRARRRRRRRHRRRLLRRPLQPADVDRRSRRLERSHRRGARGWRHRRRRHRPPRVRARRSPRPGRRRHRRRIRPAFRSADGVRRSARRVHRRPRERGPRPARADRRSELGHRRPPGAATRPPDPRAAHPAREGDVQHLHRAGPARQHRRALRGVARARGPRPHR